MLNKTKALEILRGARRMVAMVLEDLDKEKEQKWYKQSKETLEYLDNAIDNLKKREDLK